MTKIKILALVACCLSILIGCDKDGGRKAADPDPFYGMWSDSGRNYCLIISGDRPDKRNA